MTDDVVLHTVLGPDSLMTLSSCANRERETRRGVQVFTYYHSHCQSVVGNLNNGMKQRVAS